MLHLKAMNSIGGIMDKNIVIVLAGGVGSRTGLDRPKQFVEVLGKPILAYTCDIFQKIKRSMQLK